VRVFEALSASSPGSMHLIDSSIIRAHPVRHSCKTMRPPPGSDGGR
jgi:hypothetical protein